MENLLPAGSNGSEGQVRQLCQDMVYSCTQAIGLLKTNTTFNKDKLADFLIEIKTAFVKCRAVTKKELVNLGWPFD
jgi:hypothetical protein